jgi:hypothetical protein
VRFLDHLSEKGDVRAAAARVGMSRQSAYVLRRRDRVFGQGWEAALALARRHVEEVLATRALDGVEEPVFYHGEQVAVRRRYDTRLLLAHLARLDRAAGADVSGEGVEDLAGRFDEVLALLAGEAPEADMVCSADAGSRALAATRPASRPDPVLPVGRAVYVDRMAEPYAEAAYEAWLGAVAAGEAGPEDEPDEGLGVWRSLAGAAWDVWQDRAFAAVDAVCGVSGGDGADGERDGESGGGQEGPLEFKSLDGRPGEGAGGAFSVSGPCQPCQPRADTGAWVRGPRRMFGSSGNPAGGTMLL